MMLSECFYMTLNFDIVGWTNPH